MRAPVAKNPYKAIERKKSVAGGPFMARSMTTQVPRIIINTTNAAVKIPQANPFARKNELMIERTTNPVGTKKGDCRHGMGP